jgi:hypothetical protein
MQRHVDQIKDWCRPIGEWVNRTETWRMFVTLCVGIALLAVLTAIPALLVGFVLLLMFAAAVFFFAQSWLHEFTFLMRVEDDAFPGRNDKLIWAILLIFVPPVGIFLFRSYRQAHWPEAKPKSPVHDFF